MFRYFSIVTLLLLLLIPMGCQDELRDRYRKPNTETKPTIGEFFTAMLSNERVRPSYWEISTFVNWHVGVYTQSVGYLNGLSMYQQNESYIQDRWDDYYRPGPTGAGVMATFREIERTYSKLSTVEKKEAEVFIHAAKVVLYDQTSQMVDLWGDIPFSEAGSLNGTGQVIYPKFDSAEEIYETIIEDLSVVATYFSDSKLSTSIGTEFSKQDILLSGNLENWQRYANSLRLRLLMRLSFRQEEKSKEKVLELLGNESLYPLLQSEPYIAGEHDILLSPLSSYALDLHDAFLDWTNYPAPYYALEEVLKPANDLRIPVLYDKFGITDNDKFVPNSDYNALPLTLTKTEQQEKLQLYAILDSATFLFNSKLPGILFTASEINFLRAEAYERWGGGDARREYLKGVENSIRFYFYLNSLNTVMATPLVPPTSREIEDFLSNSRSIQYTGSSEEKLERIATQKWIHFGFLQSIHGWSEYRRTGYPQLPFYPSTQVGYELPPVRLTYPWSEKTYNENYNAVAARDFRNTKIFWCVK